VNTEQAGSDPKKVLQKTCNGLIWVQTLIWSFVLVGASGLSIYAWFENPEPWASIGQIWMVVGGMTVAVFLLSAALTGITVLMEKATRTKCEDSIITS
jgi:hypothetical protein